MRFYFQIDSSLGSNHAFLANVQWDAMEEDSYSVSKPLQSNVNPAHLDFSDDNARHKKGKDRLSNRSFLSNACDISNQYLAPGVLLVLILSISN